MKNIVAVFLWLALAVTSQFALAAAAEITTLQGTAQATPQTGATRTLKLGDSINELDTIKTGDKSSLVMRFEDGQTAALSANSSMKVSAYTYDFKEPAKGNVLLSLLTGGMRSLTGLIGKARPDRVAYQAGIYTIGIRGTDVTFILSSGSFVVTVLDGRISLKFVNSAGVETDLPISAPNAAYFSTGTPVSTGTIDDIRAQMRARENTLDQNWLTLNTGFVNNAVQAAFAESFDDVTRANKKRHTCGGVPSCN